MEIKEKINWEIINYKKNKPKELTNLILENYRNFYLCMHDDKFPRGFIEYNNENGQEKLNTSRWAENFIKSYLYYKFYNVVALPMNDIRRPEKGYDGLIFSNDDILYILEVKSSFAIKPLSLNFLLTDAYNDLFVSKQSDNKKVI